MLSRQPLAFERNDGQFDRSVRYSARGDQYEVALRTDGVRLAMADAGGGRTEIGLRFLGGRPARAIAGGRAASWPRLLRAASSQLARAAAEPTFGRVRATGIYDGIDVEYDGRDRKLEYDFLVAPGADPGDIALAFDGVDAVAVDPTGDLLIRVGAQTIRQHRPVAYQLARDGRRPVAADYLVVGTHRVVIALGDYDRDLPLVIDPVITYSSHL